MGLGFFVIAILGCADGGSACTPVATLQAHYATEAQCSAASGEALMANSGFDYPTLVARCRRGETKAADDERAASDKRRRG